MKRRLLLSSSKSNVFCRPLFFAERLPFHSSSSSSSSSSRSNSASTFFPQNDGKEEEGKRARGRHRASRSFSSSSSSSSVDDDDATKTPRLYSFAVVGSGPAGMYAVDKLLQLNARKKNTNANIEIDGNSTSNAKNNNNADVRVDVYEKECFPYGLVRYGVAPDHAATKNVTNKFDALLRDARVRLFANVRVGGNTGEEEKRGNILRVSTRELLERYSGVVLAHGAADNDRKLRIENEDALRGVYGARQFVNWFNGLPSAAPTSNKEMHEDIVNRLQNKKNGSNVVIVGVGNVALDCARILLRSTEELRETDIATHALEALEKAEVNSVTIVGRRSVAQAKFSPKELREVLGLPDLDVQIDDLEVAEEDIEEMNASRPRRRAFEVLEKAKKAAAENVISAEGTEKKKKILRVIFLHSPTGLLPEDDASSSSLGFVKIRKNILQGPSGNRKATLSADAAKDETILPCDILIRSVGYVGDKLDPKLVPSDDNGTISHDGLGRVQYNEEDPSSASATKGGRLYVCGWAKRGASGVIATNVQCAEETVGAIEQDVLAGLLKPASTIVSSDGDDDDGKNNYLLFQNDDDDNDKKNLLVTASKWFKLDAVERGEEEEEEENETNLAAAKKKTSKSSKSRTKIVDRDRALAIVRDV